MREPDVRSVTAPFPLLRSERDLGNDRVQIDVPRGAQKVSFGHDWAVREAILEEVSKVLVLAVPPTRVLTRELLHSAGKVDIWNLNKQMCMRRHQAVPEHVPSVLPRDAFEQPEVDAAIVIVDKDPTAVVAPRREVIDPARFHLSRRSRHSRTLRLYISERKPRSATCSNVGALLHPCLTPGHD